ncbi:MAG: T9SS type A sorting domain-containing protein, partial [Phaeodactylibacter sp.]|nr:T9SS type A sorting domain-containing protein [Phaeodactylibacter sp.]
STTLTTVVAQLPAGYDTLVSFDAYLPTAEGTYSTVFTNSITADVLEGGFVITADTWAPDNGVLNGFAGPSEAQFATGDSYKYHAGSLCLVSEVPTYATHISFGIANGADVFLGDPAFDFISVILYDGDANNDNTLDWATTGAAFDNLSAVGLGNYLITGTETASDPMIMVPLLEIATGSSAVEMKANGAYYGSIQYDGQAGLATVAPAFVTSGDVGYLNFPTTPIFIDQLYTGWAGEIVACRVHVDPTVGVEDVEMLDADKISISPNPASDFVNLKLDLVNVAEQVRVDIINYDGKVVDTRFFDNVQNNNFEFNVSDFPAGHYFFSVKTPEGYNNTAVFIAH